MGSFTNDMEVEVLKLVTGQATAIFTTTPLAAVWLRLTTTAPTDSAAGTEQTHADYDPVDTKGDWAAPVSGSPSSVTNSVDISFGTATGTWTEIVGAEIWTATTGGTRLAHGTLTTPQTPAAGNPVLFPAGSLVLTLD